MVGERLSNKKKKVEFIREAEIKNKSRELKNKMQTAAKSGLKKAQKVKYSFSYLDNIDKWSKRDQRPKVQLTKRMRRKGALIT